MRVLHTARELFAPWTLLVGAGAVVLTLGIERQEGVLALVTSHSTGLTPAVESGQLWRLASAPLVHATAGHLLRAMPAFVALGLLYERSIGRRFPLLLLTALVLPTAAVLVTQPELEAYYGLSGATNALLVAGFVWEWRRSRGRLPGWYPWVVGAYAVKLCYELATGGLLMPTELGPRVVPSPMAHLAGAVGGLAVMAWPGARSA